MGLARDAWMNCLRVVGVMLLVVVGAVVAGPADDVRARVKSEGRELKVLFVGNSYSFDVPKAFARIAKQEGRTVDVRQATKGGRTLQGQLDDKNVVKMLSDPSWDIVVFQEQSQLPSFPPNQLDKMSVPALKELVEVVRKGGAIPVLFQTWGRRDGDTQNRKDDQFEKMNQRISDGYQRMANSVEPPLYVVPVGAAWAEVMTSGKGAKLYQNDGSHPSKAGVELAAAVFYATLYYDKPAPTSLSPAIGAERQSLVNAVAVAMRGERAVEPPATNK